MPTIREALLAVRGETQISIKPIVDKLNENGFNCDNDSADAGTLFARVSESALFHIGLNLRQVATVLDAQAAAAAQAGGSLPGATGAQAGGAAAAASAQPPAAQPGGMGSGGGASSAGLSSILAKLDVVTTEQEQLKMLVQQQGQLVQQEVLPRLRKLEISESSQASSSSQSGKNFIDRKQKECKEAARKLYGVEPRYCHVTGRTWQEREIVSCSHIISRGWHKQNPINFERAGLKNEWDPRGTLFFIKRFEQEFDRGNVCLVWSGLDDKQLDSYKVKVLDPNLLDKPLSSTLGGDSITFGQVNGKDISFLNDARPSKRAVNLHASWAHKQAASLSKQAPASGVVTLNEINELPESVWSQSSWKEYVEGWLAKGGSLMTAE